MKTNIISRITLKKIKTGFGHDRNGLMCDFYLDGKRMGEFHDDGYGGETEIEFVNRQVQEVFEKFLTDNNFAQIMFDNNWGFMKDVNRIDLHTQTVNIVEEAFNNIEMQKAKSKIAKLFATSIVYGIPNSNGYKYTKFKVPLAAVVLSPANKIKLQAALDEIRAKLGKGEEIFNTNLKELGLK